MLYLDHAATTPLRAEAREAMEPYAGDVFGNPSGVHDVSRRAKNALEEARERAAELLGAQPGEVVFTAGGTEADNAALKGRALQDGRGGVVTTAVEHEAVLESARFLASLGCPVSVVGSDPLGRVDPEEVTAAVTPETSVVSVMAANNETGARQPVGEVAEAVKRVRQDVAVHTDAVQAFVSEGLHVDELGVDLLSLAAHKFGGPKGVGLLYVRRGVQLEPVLHGGGQELGRRSGTHNLMGIAGMVAAMEATVAQRGGFRNRVEEARRRFEQRLQAAFPELVVNGPVDDRLVQHSHLRIPGVRSETLLVRLDRAGLAASAGSACQSGAARVSHVLAAMGMPPAHALECLRFTFGWTTRAEDGDRAAQLVTEAVHPLKGGAGEGVAPSAMKAQVR
ncbi:MAG: cysteine desulfurase [Actinomycetota bacterium]|nr:cysteine desulfurase [Actinomycetota bacterium]